MRGWRVGCRMRLRESTGWWKKKMFGGLAFMVKGNMAAGILGDRLMVRVGADGL